MREYVLSPLTQVFFFLVSLILTVLLAFGENFGVKDVFFYFVFLAVLFLGIRFFPEDKEMKKDRRVWILTAVLLFIELFLSLHIFFRAGFDSGELTWGAYDNVYRYRPEIRFFASNDYLNLYPNNLVLLGHLMLMAIIARTLGKSFVFYMALQVGINCLIYASSAFMTYQCVKKLTGSRNIATLSWVFFLVLLGTSPWIVVSYSDSLALFIPILIVTIRLFHKGNPFVRFGLMAFLGILGFYIKPQVSIIFIAYVLLDGFEALAKKKFKEIAGSVLIFVLIGLLITTPLNAVKDKYLDRDQEIGMAHYFLIGMNYETQGMYSKDDLDFSCSFDTPEERNKADLEKAFERIESYGVPKLMDHFRNKILLTYNDGTFSFGDEGQFYNDFFPKLHFPLTDLFHEIFLDFGKYYNITSVIRQAAWIFVLLLDLISAVFKKKDGTIDIVRLGLVGLFLFELLFESRGRYLLTYVPLFILLASVGFKDILDFFRNKKQN